jgi:hypothetical protein
MPRMTKTARRWQHRLGSTSWDSATWRWMLTRHGDPRLRPVLKRGLADAIRREQGQQIPKWHWASLLSRASGITVYVYELRPANIARTTPWTNPWKQVDGQFQIHQLAGQGGVLVCHPEMPVVARFEPFSSNGGGKFGMREVQRCW